MSRRLTEALRAALGHDGSTPEPAPQPPTEIPSTAELSARLDAQLATPIEYVTPDLRDVTSLAGAALALGAPTVNDAARELIAMGKAAPTHLLYDANVLLAAEQKAEWNPKLHPRDRNGRFIEVGAILNLLGSVGGGRGTVVGNGPNNHVIVRKADGTEVDVPASQTYSDQSAQDRVGKPGELAGEVGKPGTFADTPAADAPKKPKPDAPAEGRILPTDLPNDPAELSRALYSNRAVGRDEDRLALNATRSALSASGDGREMGRNLATRAGDQETNDRIAAGLDRLDQIADELEADGNTATTADGTPLPQYLRDYAAGFREIHEARIGVTAEAEADTGWMDVPADTGPNPNMPGQEELVTANAADTGVPDVLGTPEPSRAEARGAQVVTEPDTADPETDVASLRGRRMALRQAAAAADAGDYERSDAILARLPERTPTGTPEVTPATAGDAAVANRGGAVMPESGPPGERPQVDALDPQFDVAQLRGRREALRQAADAAAKGDYDRADAIIGRLSGTDRTPSPATEALADIPVAGRPDGAGTADDPIDVGDDVDLAVQLLADGKHVRLNQPDEVATLLDKVREIVAESKAKGEDAPTFDLCNVSVPGTNLFCAENKGIKRIEMPQLSGIPLPGTPADAMEKNEYGGVDLAEDFVAALQEVGVAVTDETRPASHLRASQMELDGAKVSGIAKAMETADGPDALNDAPIFVTRDGYVIDGHHRWAAKVGLDVADNELGDVDMNVRVVDMDIGAALDFANAFATRMGIPGADVTDNPVADAETKPDTIEFAGETLRKGKDSLYDHLIPDGQGGYKLTPEREALHKQIITDTLAGVPRSENPSFYMLGGGPAAGKSTMLGDAALEGVPDDEGMLNGQKVAVVVNPDNVKAVLPEYTSMIDGGQAKNAAGFVHEESSFLAKQVQKVALEGQRDVVLDGTGDSSLLKLLKKVKQARDAGHSVKGFYATIPTDLAWERADARAQQTGRHVHEDVLRSTHSAVSRVVPEAAHHFDEFTLFDTTNGARPIARAVRDGEVEVLDEAAYAEFLDKGFEGSADTVEDLQARLDQTTAPALRAALQRQIDALNGGDGGGPKV